jgi:hypothetical protein
MRTRDAKPNKFFASSSLRFNRTRSLSRPSRYSSVITPVGVMLSVTAFTYLSPSSSRFTLATFAGDTSKNEIISDRRIISTLEGTARVVAIFCTSW